MRTLYKKYNEHQQLTKSTTSIVDLFSGCGGLAYGFIMENLPIKAGVEIDLYASRTASYNLQWKFGNKNKHINKDIKEVNASELISSKHQSIVTIGGPPCQAYSIVGRAKILSLGEERFGINDKRAFLYKEFIRLALELESEAIVMENVPEAVNFQGMNIPQIVCDDLNENGYNAIWTILNAADYGVPQTRRRVFVIAIKKKYGEVKHLPIPTHSNLFQRTDDEQLVRYQRFKDCSNFRFPNVGDLLLPTWVTSDEALSDLPSLFSSSKDKYPQIKMETRILYRSYPLNDFQKQMRKVENEKYMEEVDSNSFRRTTRDYRIFERMKPNANYLDAHKIALNLFKEACSIARINKNKHPEAYNDLKREYVPPYDTSKFHTKWRRLDAQLPSHTLVAHLGVDTYSHIHPFEPRGISVREAARLQSFPDSFVFNVPMGSAFKQIGNAVPPLLAKAVAKAVKKNLNLL